MPVPVIVPPVALQVTAVLVALPTVAVKLWVAPVFSDTESGEMVTFTAAAGRETAICDTAFLVLSAWLVAVTV